MRHRLLVPVASLVLMGMTLCASIGVTASRSDTDAWAGCDAERAALDRFEESLSPFPLLPSPRLRPLSMTEPCITVRRELATAGRRLGENRPDQGPEDTQIYRRLLAS